jgi:hypothetical protein
MQRGRAQPDSNSDSLIISHMTTVRYVMQSRNPVLRTAGNMWVLPSGL